MVSKVITHFVFITYEASSSILAGCRGTFVNVHFTVGPSIARVTGTNIATICVLWIKRGEGGEGRGRGRGDEGGGREMREEGGRWGKREGGDYMNRLYFH